MNFYNEFAEHYDKWVSNDTQAKKLTQWYCQYLNEVPKDTSLVYLGIATGRIALELVKQSSLNVIGVDKSEEMLTLCEKNFLDAGLEAKMSLLHQDILNLDISSSNNIFILPFRTLVHFLSIEDKKSCLMSIYKNMEKSEIFIFDMDLFNEEAAKKDNGDPSLSVYDEGSGDVLYNQFTFNFDAKVINVTVYKGVLKDGKLEGITQHRYNSSWISTKDMNIIINEVGFCVQDYICKDSHQTWIVQK